MIIVIFLVVLAVLIFVHELGHFLVAKRSGIRVDEFAIGFPPKIFSWTRGETKYVLNLIPFGGYVKIFGENPDDESMTGADSKRSFVNAKKWKQVCVLVAGIGMNIIFAWILISISFMVGSNGNQIVLTSVAEKSPAQQAGLMQGDKIISVDSITGKDLSTDVIIKDISNNTTGAVSVTFERKGVVKQVNVTPEFNKVENKKIVGIYMENINIEKVNPFLAMWDGLKLTASTFGQVTLGLILFIFHAVSGHADYSQVSGPVGIVGMVGDAVNFGFAYLLVFVAFISLSLAAINLVPFPALDGGRVLFVAIEAVIRRPIKPAIANTVNTVGFFILIGLMLIVTYRDIVKLF